jgi:hypothetical protein
VGCIKTHLTRNKFRFRVWNCGEVKQRVFVCFALFIFLWLVLKLVSLNLNVLLQEIIYAHVWLSSRCSHWFLSRSAINFQMFGGWFLKRVLRANIWLLTWRSIITLGNLLSTLLWLFWLFFLLLLIFFLHLTW